MPGRTAVLTLRASAILTNAYVASTAVVLPPGVTTLNVRAIYTRSAGIAACAPSIIVETGDDGTDFFPAAIVDSTITASGPAGQTTAYQWSMTLAAPGTNTATNYGYVVRLVAGSLLRVRCIEAGAPGTPGTLAITAIGDVG